MSATAAPKTTALDLLKRNEAALSNETKERWALEQLVTVWNTVAEGATFGEFAMFISLADRYQLNPLAHEIWFGKNKKSGKVMIMVGRDGLLAIARRTGDFRTIRGDVHRKNDHFKVIHLPDGTDTVEHSYEGGAAERGEIQGSWAQVIRTDGTATNFTYTPLSEYLPEGTSQYSAWGKTTSAMIQKCSVSLALRIAYGISGVVGEDEVEGQVAQSLSDGEGNPEAVVEEVELPPEIEDIVTRAEELGATGWNDRGVWRYRIGMGENILEAAIAEATKQLDAMESRREQFSEADVVEAQEDQSQDFESSENLGGGEDPPVDEVPDPITNSSTTAEGSVEDIPAAQDPVAETAEPSEEMRQLLVKRGYIASMEAIGEEEEAQKDEALDLVDEQISKLRAREEAERAGQGRLL